MRKRRAVWRMMGMLVLLIFALTNTTLAAKIQLKVWDWHTSEFPDLMKQFYSEFEKENPEVQLLIEASVWSQMFEKYVKAYAAGTLPDICETNAQWISEMSAYALPLEPFIEKEGGQAYLSQFIPALVDIMKVNGHYCWVPFFAGTEIFQYNVKHLEQAGLDVPKWWEDVKEAVVKLKELNGGNNIPYILPADTELAWPVLGFMATAGGRLMEDGKVVIDNPGMIAALYYLRDLNLKYKALPINWAATSKKMARELAATEKGSFWSDGPWFSGFANDLNPNLKWDAALPPRLTMTGAGFSADGWMININTPYKEIGWKFLKHMSSEKTNRLLAQHRGVIPTRESVLQEPVVKEHPHLGPFVKAMYVRNLILEGGMPRAMDKLTEIARQALAAGMGQKSPEEAAKAMQKYCEER